MLIYSYSIDDMCKVINELGWYGIVPKKMFAKVFGQMAGIKISDLEVVSVTKEDMEDVYQREINDTHVCSTENTWAIYINHGE